MNLSLDMVVVVETINAMLRMRQVRILLWVMAMSGLISGEVSASSERYEEVQVESPVFLRGLSMFGREQDEYATNLTAHALIQLQQRGGDVKSWAIARKMIALALNLSPRNDHASAANKKLAQGQWPKRVNPDNESKVFARLLLTRSKILSESGAAKDGMLARYFLELSVVLDPEDGEATRLHNEDVRNNGVLDWALITGDKAN